MSKTVPRSLELSVAGAATRWRFVEKQHNNKQNKSIAY